MTRPAIIINELDAERIDRLLEQPAFANSPVADALNEELDRAQMLAPEAMPHDVVTMNSRVKFRDLTSGEERVRTLVFPSQVTDSASQLSVLAPVGAALLGLKVGSTIHWELPGGASTHPGSAGAIVPAGSRWRIPPLIPLPEAFRALFRGCPHILFLLFSRRLPFLRFAPAPADSFAT